VSVGTLLINGTNTSSAVTVSSGATLGGSGSLGDVTIASGGILAPGNSPGHLDVASLSLGNGSILNFEANGTNAAQYDSIYADKGFVFGGTLNIAISGIYDSTNNIGLFELFRNGTGTLGGGTNNFQAVTLSGTYSGSLAYYAGNNLWQLWDGTNSYVGLDMTTGVLTVIPEPSTYAFLALGALVMVVASRRKKVV